MDQSFEQVLVEVWRQALVDNLKAVKLGGESYSVRRTSKKGLRQVDFVFDGEEIRGLEQNPDTKSRWAQMSFCEINKTISTKAQNTCIFLRSTPASDFFTAYSQEFC